MGEGGIEVGGAVVGREKCYLLSEIFSSSVLLIFTFFSTSSGSRVSLRNCLRYLTINIMLYFGSWYLPFIRLKKGSFSSFILNEQALS